MYTAQLTGMDLTQLPRGRCGCSSECVRLDVVELNDKTLTYTRGALGSFLDTMRNKAKKKKPYVTSNFCF